MEGRGKGSVKRKIPPFGRRAHRLTHAQARRMRERFRRRHGKDRRAIRPAAYGRNIFDAILRQKGCVGIRVYPGIDDDGELTLLFVGVNAEGDDILAGIIGDTPWRCPPFCSSTNGVLEL